MSTDPVPRLVLVGAPGSGKTSVARHLARQWGAPVVDVDALIEERARLPREEIIAVAGEDQFRSWEREAVMSALERPGAVVATSSGCITDPVVRAALAPLPVVWLRIDATHSSRRSGLSALAPSLFAGMRVRLIQQLAERDPLYACVADHTVDTSRLTSAEACAAVVEWSHAVGRGAGTAPA